MSSEPEQAPVIIHHAEPTPTALSLPLVELHRRLVNLAAACEVEYGADSAECQQATLLASSVGKLVMLGNGVRR